MLSLMVCAALAQAPVKVAVLQSSNLGVAAKRTDELTLQLIALMRANGLEPLESSLPCQNRVCVVAAAKQLEAPAVVSAAFALVGKEVVMDLECIGVDDGKTLVQTTFTSTSTDLKLEPEALKFVYDVKTEVTKVSAVAELKSPTLVPEPNPTPNPVTGIVEPAPHSRVPGALLGGAAVALGAVSIAFAVIGLDQRNRVWSSPDAMHSSLTMPQAEQLVFSSNTNFSIGSILGGVATGLLVGALALLLY